MKEAGRNAGWALLASVGLTVALYWVPYGRYAAWPLLLLSTLAHEMGHGIAAWLAGGSFESLRMWADASGTAITLVPAGRVPQALVAAGGLVGPAIAAGALFALARNPRLARATLYGLGALLLVAEVLVVRNLFGLFFVACVALASLALARWGSPAVARFSIAFVAVQLALSVFSRADYLFTKVARTSTGTMPSDTAQIARALLLPYWFWGALCGALSVAILWLGLRGYLPRTGSGIPVAEAKDHRGVSPPGE